MNHPIIRAAIFGCVTLLLLTAGCTSNKPYRTGFSPDPADLTLPGPNPTNTVIEVTPNYKLGFVEFDDQGWFWNVTQKVAVVKMIRKEAGIESGNPEPVIMVLFVHGWKNDAAYDNDNVKTFRTVLTQLNRLEITVSQAQKRSPRKLLGIYAGWRGLSVKSDYFPLPFGKELSFWNRKDVAQRVGGYGAMTELMMDLEALQKTNNSILPQNGVQSKLLIVGHSFGADAVYNSISQIITERFVHTIKQGQGQLLKPLGDQVILLNPAFEATRLYDLKQLAASVAAYPPYEYPLNQRPVLSIFQSKGDWATGKAFPIGQRFGTLFQKNRNAFQKSANLKSVGWFGPFVTHELQFNPGAAGSTTGNTNQLRTPEELPGAVNNIVSQRQIWRQAPPVSTNVFGKCVLTSKPGYQPRNPIVVVSVDTQIMKDHNDIGNPVLINFLQEYIPFCDNDPSLAPDGFTDSQK